MSETGEVGKINTINKVVKGITRRTFLKRAAGLALGLGVSNLLPGEPNPQQPLANKEIEPTINDLPLIVDFTPLPDTLAQEQSSGLITRDTKAFNIEEFFERIAHSSYAELEKQFKLSEKSESPLLSESGIEYLFKKGHKKEAICLSLAYQWSYHGNAVVHAMRNFRDARNRPITEQKLYVDGLEALPGQYNTREVLDLLQKGRAVLKNVEQKPTNIHRVEPYHILPLQDYIADLKEVKKVDQWGNPYFYVIIDHQKLAQTLKNSPYKIINCSFNFGNIPIRLGYKLPEGQTANVEEGWTNGKYSGTRESTQGEMVIYSVPAIALETSYSNPENFTPLTEFANALPDRFIVTATGNSATHIGNISLPKNLALVAAWNEGSQKPQQDIEGPPRTVYYADPSETTGDVMSSIATAMTAEWLSEQNITDINSVKNLLNQHSKIQVDGNRQVLDFGKIPVQNGDWDNPEKYKKLAS